ncbi:succinyldiaminopimelate transaminase [Buchananella felis]|uniref:succinyldiaminopimelate transaminase n=1 Tax=Buchananella felis TaxID=3231492 RepID=UPI003528F7D0
MARLPRALPLPEFPWNTLEGARLRAQAHPGGIVDLSVGTPVDDSPAVATQALAAAANSPGYPLTVGTAAVRQAICDWFARRRSVPGLKPSQVIPTIGSKEAVALLPLLLGAAAGDTVLLPAMAYPTYDVGARLAGATPIPVGDDPQQWPDADLVWLNSPGNPHGHVLSVEQLRRIVAWARRRGAMVVSDECYAELAWEVDDVPSLLDPRVTDGDLTGLLALYSLSKQSNLAGYRAALLAGDEAAVAAVVETRKHLGLLVPGPVQAALVAALGDDGHVDAQREVYRRRRDALAPAARAAGMELDPDSRAGLYLWGRVPGLSGRDLVDRLAELGILAAPGDFYGEQAAPYVRIALTASDERIDAAVKRLSGASLA